MKAICSLIVKPIVLVACLFIVTVLFNTNIFCIMDLIDSSFISMTATIITVLLGFIATTFAVFFSITDRPVFVRLKNRGAAKDFVFRFVKFFIISLFVLAFSLILVKGRFQEYVYLNIFYVSLIEMFVWYFSTLLYWIVLLLLELIEHPHTI
jgi:hypothetical protein